MRKRSDEEVQTFSAPLPQSGKIILAGFATRRIALHEQYSIRGDPGLGLSHLAIHQPSRVGRACLAHD
ncbi:hypothetical protein BOO88_14260 [Stutzerimonas stutzeri]|nr:hypothetical protein BOO88_14260 [Stutzerimonas stutzeri]